MAVQRDSQKAQVNRPQAGLTSIPGTVTHAPDPGKFVEPQSTSDSIINSLLPVGHKAAQDAWASNTEEAYLQGVSQAARGVSEADLNSDPITSAWTGAGYRDTKGRLTVAESMMQLQTDLHDMVTKPNAEDLFQNAMADQNAVVTEAMKGMSRKQRAALFAQQANDILAQQAQFTKLRKQYIIDQEKQSIQADFTARRLRLDGSKDDPAQYLIESRGFAAAVYRNVFQNPKIVDPASRQKLATEAIQYAISTDNYGVYDMLKSMQFDFGNGKSGSIMQQLPLDTQVKLDTAYRQSKDRTKTIRAASFEDAMAKHRANWANGVIDMTYPELSNMLDKAGDLVDKGTREARLKEYFTAAAKAGNTSKSAAAWAAGDIGTLSKMNVSEDQGLKAWLNMHKDMPYDQKVQVLLSTAYNSGMPSAFTQVGKMLAAPLASLGLQKEIDPNAAKTIASVVTALDYAEAHNPGAYTSIMKAMPPEGQTMLGLIRHAQQTGITDPTAAAEYARSIMMKQDSAPNLIQAQRRTANQEDAKIVQGMGYNSVLSVFGVHLPGGIGTSWGAVKSFFSSTARDKYRTRPAAQWFEDKTRFAEAQAVLQYELAGNLEQISKNNPWLPADVREKRAYADLARRAIDTVNGPVIVPRGNDIHSYFGAPAVADPAYIGKALDALYPQVNGERNIWRVTPDGNLMLEKMSSDGLQLPGSMIIDPKTVGAKVQDMLLKDARNTADAVGPGVVVKSSDGQAHVQFNGTNTVGIDAKSMLALRRDIVDSESVRSKVYTDTKGYKTFGVGIAQTGTYYQNPNNPDGTYTQSQINDSFMQASNEAAQRASNVMQRHGLSGDKWLRFFGELAYQSPASAMDTNMLSSIMVHDLAGATSALKATAAYKASGERRRKVYLDKLRKAMQ